MMSSTGKKPGPNPNTIADGYSVTDERRPVSGPDLDFDYDKGDKDSEPAGGADLPNPDKPKLHQSHPGEHRGDYGGTKVKIPKKVYIWALCAALNSCNLGYDIGVNTGAGPLLQEDLGLSDIQIELFFGSLNLYAMVGGLAAHWITDRLGRRNAFVVSNIFFIIGIVVQTVAQGYEFLMVGRVFVGLGVGFGLAVSQWFPGCC
jgi:hypothetical protein